MYVIYSFLDVSNRAGHFRNWLVARIESAAGPALVNPRPSLGRSATGRLEREALEAYEEDRIHERKNVYNNLIRLHVSLPVV